MPSFEFHEFDELVPEPDCEAAARFCDDWFDAESNRKATVTSIQPGRLHGTRNRQCSPLDLADTFRERGMNDLIYEDGKNWNVFVTVGLLREGELERANAKGGKKDIESVPGVWADLDVKDGCFTSEEHALSFLRTVNPLPSTVVATGSGGVHAYWKTKSRLPAAEAEELCARWWLKLTRDAGVKIDKLTNCDRIMKIPGSIRWAKAPGDTPQLVRLLYSTSKPVAGAAELVAATDALWDEYCAVRVRERESYQERRREALKELDKLDGWNRLMALADVEDRFNDEYTWHDVLEPLGWTDLGTDPEARVVWARPGLGADELRKSAATNYQDSNVMTLFSDSPATGGLWQLREAGFVLTPYRVWVQCVWHGDEAAAIRNYLRLGDGE